MAFDRAPGRAPVVTSDAERETAGHRLIKRIFPEAQVSGFAHIDQEVAFFTQVAALLRPDDVVLDFGAGRGAWLETEPSLYKRWLHNFRGRCAHVDGCDVDPVVKDNPTLDAAATFAPGEALPYPDNRFDLIVSRYVFEHLPDPEWAARELLRVLRPGGWICALTPNKWGYVALASRLLPNRHHARALSSVQPGRQERDVFPTVYRLNRPADVRRHFGHGADVFHYSTSAVPSYHFGSALLFRLLRLVHRLTPPPFDVGLRFFIRKREAM
ncbi:class I SAM-dependent methyltransferase [Sphingomonas piscis]|uniref:Class I SAM-dependent methyltransferase n=2 Tax=Sphingomonas piscis TaxID=2714943 RepID=A0A6G7YTH4_9SPHN|nr:class I SAM-dependent methyltransferase [Sphingomonas piscis]